MSSRYQFVTNWTIDAPVEAVWAEISRPDDWPAWWRGVLAVELLEAGDQAGVGAYRRMTWRSALPYRLCFNMRTTLIDPLVAIEGVADGELSGTGRWVFGTARGGTRVQYDWEVEATRPWMRLFAPVGRPLFAWNHDVVMKWGLQGLERRLGAPQRNAPAR